MLLRYLVIDPLITAVVATWLVGFGAAAAGYAIRQRRHPATWVVFGAVLGPAALALLRIAPPGRCWSCEAPTQGWLSQCLWCDEDVHEPAPEVPEEEVLPPGPLIVIEGSAPRTLSQGSAGRSATERASYAGSAGSATDRNVPPAPARRGLAALPSLPRIELPARTPVAEPERRAPAASVNLEPAPDPVRRLKASLGRSGQSVAAAEVAPAPVAVAASSAEPHNIVLASAIYVTGTRGLQAGSRYGIALVGYDLRILGPVDTDPTAVAILHSLRGVDATGLQGRLIITAGDGRRDRLALVFMAVAGGSPEGVADAIVRATRDLEARLR